MIEKKLEIRGINRQDIIKYLQQLGAIVELSNSIYKSDYWSCQVSEEESFHMFQSIIPKVYLKFIAEDKAILDDVLTNFHKKTFRAGG